MEPLHLKRLRTSLLPPFAGKQAFGENGSPTNALDANGDGTILFASCGSTIVAIEAEDLSILWEFEVGAFVNQVRWAPEDNVIAVDQRGGVTLIRGETGQVTRRWMNIQKSQSLWNVALSYVGPLRGPKTEKGVSTWGIAMKGSMLAVSGCDSVIKLLDVTEPASYANPVYSEPKHTLLGHRGNLPSLDFSPEGDLIASASVDGSIRIWNTETGKQVGRHLKLKDHRLSGRSCWGVRFVSWRQIRAAKEELPDPVPVKKKKSGFFGFFNRNSQNSHRTPSSGSSSSSSSSINIPRKYPNNELGVRIIFSCARTSHKEEGYLSFSLYHSILSSEMVEGILSFLPLPALQHMQALNRAFRDAVERQLKMLPIHILAVLTERELILSRVSGAVLTRHPLTLDASCSHMTFVPESSTIVIAGDPIPLQENPTLVIAAIRRIENTLRFEVTTRCRRLKLEGPASVVGHTVSKENKLYCLMTNGIVGVYSFEDKVDLIEEDEVIELDKECIIPARRAGFHYDMGGYGYNRYALHNRYGNNRFGNNRRPRQDPRSLRNITFMIGNTVVVVAT